MSTDGQGPLYMVRGPKMLEDMTWAEVDELRQRTDIALPVVGAVEQHGPHSPLSSDIIQGTEVAKRAALKLKQRGVDVLIGPLIPFGYSPHHMSFPGTITLSAVTFHNLMREVFICLIRHGFKRIAVVNGHGGNKPSIYLAVNEVYEEFKDQGVIIAAPEWMGGRLYPFYTQNAKSDYPQGEFHQGERATSLTLAARPELVDMSKAVTYYSPEYEQTQDRYGSSVNLPYLIKYDMRKLTPVGHIGNAPVATAELGNKQYEAAAEFIADFVLNEFPVGAAVGR